MIKEFTAAVTFGGSAGSHSDRVAHLTVVDATSGVNVLEMTFSAEELGRIMSNQGYVRCTAELFDTFKTVNMIHQNKTVEVRDPEGKSLHGRIGMIRELAAYHEVDGWKATRLDNFNGHEVTADGYQVHFSRFVESA